MFGDLLDYTMDLTEDNIDEEFIKALMLQSINTGNDSHKDYNTMEVGVALVLVGLAVIFCLCVGNIKTQHSIKMLLQPAAVLLNVSNLTRLLEIKDSSIISVHYARVGINCSFILNLGTYCHEALHCIWLCYNTHKLEVLETNSKGIFCYLHAQPCS